MRKQTAIWTCKDGSKLRICDMTDSHLENAIKLIERTFEASWDSELHAAYCVYGGLNGEMAQFQCEQDIAMMENEDPISWLYDHDAGYRRLVDEKERREIATPKSEQPK